MAAGFKGGEVVPSFFVGATFGCAVAPLLGLPAGFGAAVGLAAVFCGVTNCPLASTLLAVGVGARVMEGAPEPVGAFEAAEGVDSPDGCLWQPVGKASNSAARRQIPHLFIINPSFPFLKTVVL